jgi:molybdenum cofactor synthesis domain-containing protein
LQVEEHQKQGILDPVMKTAQILIVGDEILSGRTVDTNSHYLAKELFARGIRVRRIEVVPDDIVAIAQWVHHRHGLSDIVFVCGGIGGTPDDVTREAVARGVAIPIERNQEALKRLTKYYAGRKVELNADRMRMADMPVGCTLIDNSVTTAPGFKIKNIYVMAGIPEVMHAMFDAIKEELKGTPVFESEINLQVGEGEIARHMIRINDEFPDVELGSYPTLDPKRGYKTQLVFKAATQDRLKAAVDRFDLLMKKNL